MTPQSNGSENYPRLQTVGIDGLLITFADRLSDGANRAALAFRAMIETAKIEGIKETTTSLASTFVLFDPVKSDLEHIRAALLALLQGTDWSDVPLPQGRRLWHVPAAFGGTRGPQLDEAAKLAGIDRDQAIEEMTNTRVRVLTIGFAPGQPYLGTLPAHWNIPRQSGLTKQVPNGAIAVAIRQLVLFTASTPTGWRMIGQTAFRGFRPDQDAPFTLGVGDEILFSSISEDELDHVEHTDQTGLGGASFEVIP